WMTSYANQTENTGNRRGACAILAEGHGARGPPSAGLLAHPAGHVAPPRSGGAGSERRGAAAGGRRSGLTSRAPRLAKDSGHHVRKGEGAERERGLLGGRHEGGWGWGHHGHPGTQL